MTNSLVPFGRILSTLPNFSVASCDGKKDASTASLLPNFSVASCDEKKDASIYSRKLSTMVDFF